MALILCMYKQSLSKTKKYLRRIHEQNIKASETPISVPGQETHAHSAEDPSKKVNPAINLLVDQIRRFLALET